MPFFEAQLNAAHADPEDEFLEVLFSLSMHLVFLPSNLLGSYSENVFPLRHRILEAVCLVFGEQCMPVTLQKLEDSNKPKE